MHSKRARHRFETPDAQSADGPRQGTIRSAARRVDQRFLPERKQPALFLSPLGAHVECGRLVESAGGGRAAMRPDLLLEVEQFLFREARLLDECRFEEWL